MGVIWTSRTRSRQPSVRVSSEQTSWLWSPGYARDAARNTTVSVDGTPTVTYVRGAKALSIDSTAKRIYSLTADTLIGAQSFTLVWRFKQSSTVMNGGTMFKSNGTSGSQNRIDIYSLPSGVVRCDMYNSSGLPTIADSAAVLAVDGLYTVALVYDYAASSLQWYVNGAASGSPATPGTRTGAGTLLEFGGGGAGQPANQDYSLLAVLPYAASVVRNREIAKNPWQLFAPERRPVFYSLPAAGGTSSAVVWNSRTRTRQPQGAVGVNQGSPIKGLKLAVNFANGLIDSVSGRTLTNAGSVFDVGPLGRCLVPTTAGIIIPWDIGLTSGNFTVTVVETRVSAPSSYWFIYDNRAASAGYYYGLDSVIYLSSGAVLTSPGYKVTSFGTQNTIQNGVVSPYTNGTPGYNTTNMRLFGRYTEENPYNNTKIAAVFIHDKTLSESEHRIIYQNPWQLFAPERRPKFFSVGSGANTYAVGISETATASETVSMLAAFGTSISETATASETVATTAVLNASISETATASETVSMTASFVVTIGETATASETVAMALGAATFAVDISETATASETVSMLAAFGTSISETATASETMSMLAAFGTSISETATASETVAMQLANQTYAVAISETATASDTVVMTIPTTYAISIIETVQAGDYVSMGVPSSDFWTQVTTTQSAGWGQINNTQSSGWTIIPTT